jgi:mannose-6-phosphate isomerase-like protein (cupin superfamily)
MAITTSTITAPRTVTNGGGETLTFLGVHEDERGPYLHVRNVVQPGYGPPMHVHHRQDEGLTVERGTIGYQRKGEQARTAGPGETVVFRAGEIHRFWNAGEDELVCDGWIGPPEHVEYFLTKLFASMEANGGRRPHLYDTAFLLTRYRSEFGMTEIPRPVQRLLFPVLLAAGRLLGWDRRFADAPPPLPGA